MKRFAVSVIVLAAMTAGPASAVEEAVRVGGSLALFDRPARPAGSVILVAGGNGRLGLQPDGQITSPLAGNQLVRTRGAYVRAGLAVLTPDRGVDLGAAVAYMRGVASPVTVVGTSRAAERVPEALAGRPDALVITSGMLDRTIRGVGDPAALPPTLIVHHRRDTCRVTLPEQVDAFVAWSQGRARVVWLDGGVDRGDPCQAAGYHGFAGLDGKVVSTVAAFAKRRRS